MQGRLKYLSENERKEIARLGGLAATKQVRFKEGSDRAQEAGRKGGLERARRAAEARAKGLQ